MITSRQRRDDAAISEDLTAEKGKVLDRIKRILGLEYKPYPVDHVNLVKTVVALGVLDFGQDQQD